ncbi:ATP-binding protein [Halopenitus salinus]|uniref:ATP-binding protein n=1 Tax=Halopenitus salinus TaxID=1198295 RepID=A0ABD5UTT2_9EURY
MQVDDRNRAAGGERDPKPGADPKPGVDPEPGPDSEPKPGSGRRPKAGGAAHVLGREGTAGGAILDVGAFLARDGSTGAPVAIDAENPHAGVLVGKRGTGKSYTLGVIAEELARVEGVSPIVLDPMGVFAGLGELPGGRVIDARIDPATLSPDVWPELLGLDPTGAAGSLLWRTVERRQNGCGALATASEDDPTSIAGILAEIETADAPDPVKRAASNHLRLADAWGIFDPAAPTMGELTGAEATVIDCRSLTPAAMAAVGHVIARGLYDYRIERGTGPLPWLLVDEAHAFLEGIGEPAFRTLFTRGRTPGVSLVCATQRPSALPDVAVSQADLVIAHRLTAERDVDALRDAQPAYLGEDLGRVLPSGTGEALVVDDRTESAHVVRVRERRTPHGGDSPTASGIEANRARAARRRNG